MHRRPFIKQLGSSFIAIPFLSNENGFSDTKGKWQGWLKQIVTACKIETEYTKLFFNELPAVPQLVKSGEFKKAQALTYFYGNGKYCFQVFERKHSAGGLLELMVPFWKRQSDGSWSKLTSISHYDLEAMAKASDEYKEKSNQFLLPVQSSPSGGFFSEKAQVHFVARLLSNDMVFTDIKVIENSGLVWHKNFAAHLPANA